MKKIISVFLCFAFIAMACTDASKDIDYTTVSGLWNCEEVDEYSNVRNYIVDIDNVVNYDDIFILSNFHNAGDNLFVRAVVNNSKLSIGTQAIGNYIVNGEGTISDENKKILLEYTVNQGSGLKRYHCIYYR